MTDRFAKVEGHPNLVKDLRTNAIINTDLAAARRHADRLQKVSKELKRDEDIQQLKDSVNSLRESIDKILELLKS